MNAFYITCLFSSLVLALKASLSLAAKLLLETGLVFSPNVQDGPGLCFYSELQFRVSEFRPKSEHCPNSEFRS